MLLCPEVPSASLCFLCKTVHLTSVGPDSALPPQRRRLTPSQVPPITLKAAPSFVMMQGCWIFLVYSLPCLDCEFHWFPVSPQHIEQHMCIHPVDICWAKESMRLNRNFKEWSNVYHELFWLLPLIIFFFPSHTSQKVARPSCSRQYIHHRYKGLNTVFFFWFLHIWIQTLRVML